MNKPDRLSLIARLASKPRLVTRSEAELAAIPDREDGILTRGERLRLAGEVEQARLAERRKWWIVLVPESDQQRQTA